MTDTDVLQVCRNGHVVTEQFHTLPNSRESHCVRCGAATMWRCETCGQPLRGARLELGLTLVGHHRPEQFCSCCGAAFPWARPRTPAKTQGPMPRLVSLLRRFPRVVQQLRWRHTDRTPFRIHDPRDVEDLLRALLPISFDEVRLECRTPHYATGTVTDFLLTPGNLALTAKLARPNRAEAELGRERIEDVDYYRSRQVRALCLFVYDREGIFRERERLEAAWAEPTANFQVCAVIAG